MGMATTHLSTSFTTDILRCLTTLALATCIPPPDDDDGSFRGYIPMSPSYTHHSGTGTLQHWFLRL